MISEIFNEKARAIDDFRAEADRIVIGLVVNHESEVLDIVKDDQLYQGIDSQGNEIKPSYTPYTVSLKTIKGQPTDRVTWLDTGDLYDSIFIEDQVDKFEIKATDNKLPGLIAKYGNALGLTEKNIERTRDIIKDDLFNAFKTALKI